jgi:soluble lytic murein transglycosylase-like protein
MKPFSLLRSVLATIAVVAMTCSPAFAAERITLRNGSEFDCVRQEAAGDHVRLYLFPAARAGALNHTTADEANYIEVNASSVLRVEIVADPPAPSSDALDGSPTFTTQLTPAEMRQMLVRAGALHNIDADLLASVVKAESNGNTLAVSRAGAKGLMQLMPSTASDLGVRNSFAPDQNIGGGTAYLDQLLIRYHDDMSLAVAAYNAGPAAVDRYHGIPPYRETRAYVARVIREFNRRKRSPSATLAANLN